MKKFRYILLFTVVAFASKAQQLPLYSNYFFTPYIYNPAMSGIDGVTEVALMHRRQWADVQGSPETSALGINGSANGEKVGWSGYFFSDRTDIIQRVGAYGNYAYHLKLADNATLSFGLGAGYLNNQIDQNAIRAKDDEIIITGTANSRGTFDVNAGINLKISDFSLGFAAPQLVGQSITYTENFSAPVNYSLLRHYVVTTSYDFKFDGDKNVLSPIVMLKTAANVPMQVDVGLIYNMKKYGYVGATYRSQYAVTANAGVNLSEVLTIGYAHDFSINKFSSQLGSSNEFMLIYRFGSNKRNERLENELKRLKQNQRKQKDEVEEIVNERLDEFKDEYKRQIEEQVKEQQASQQNNNPNQAGNQQGNQANQNGNNQQGNQGNANQGNFNNNTQQDFNNQNNGNVSPNAGNPNAVGGFSPQNQASNVNPGSPGYYVVAGVFSSQGNADKKVRQLSGQGINARYFQDPGNSYYYVYLLKFANYQQADAAKGSRLNGSYSGDLWIKIVD